MLFETARRQASFLSLQLMGSGPQAQRGQGRSPSLFPLKPTLKHEFRHWLAWAGEFAGGEGFG